MLAFNKKTLVVTSWAPPMIGGPQSLYNLLNTIDPATFSILTKRPADPNDGQISGSTLGCQYYYSDATDTSAHSEKLLLKIPSIGGFVVGILRTIKAVRKLFQRITELQTTTSTNFLLGISDTGPALLATYLAHRRLGLPYGIYLYDLYRGNNLGFILGVLARWLEPRLLKAAAFVAVTNEGTAAYLQRRYGTSMKIQVIHNSVDAKNYLAPKNIEPTPPYTILFTGHVYWAQQQAVINMIRAMDELRDLPVHLDLYIPKGNPTIAAMIHDHPNIRLTAAAQTAMPAIQAQATLLFLPLAWHTAAPDIIATATPGKFTDYLAAGRPMLVHAPEYAYVSRYTREHRLGIVVDQDNPHLLAEAIRDFLSHPDQGSEYVQNAQRIFRQNHDAVTNAKKLTELLNMV